MRVVSSFTLSSRSIVLFIALALVFPSGGHVALAKPAGHDLEILTLSTRPDTVSGGDVLVQVNVPGNVPLNRVTVNLNGLDVTAAFRPGQAPASLVGLVEGPGPRREHAEGEGERGRGRQAGARQPSDHRPDLLRPASGAVHL